MSCKYFYFVSEAPKFKNHFLFFLSFFSNLQISMVLTIFLHIMDTLLVKYDMMNFFPDFFPVSRFSRIFFRIFIKTSDFSKEWIVSFSYMMWWFSFQEIYPVSGFFPDFHQIFIFLHISSKNRLFLSHIWYDDFRFRRSIRFPDFFQDFSGFSSSLNIFFFS